MSEHCMIASKEQEEYAIKNYLKIMFPCFAISRDQIDRKISILRENSSYGIGIEINGNWEHFFDPGSIQKIKTNAEEIPEDIYLSMHAPFNRSLLSENFFSSRKGFSNLLEVLNLAEEMRVNLVNLHSSTFLTHADIKKIKNLERYKNSQVEKVGQILREAAKDYSNLQICVENMPWAWDYDITTDPEKMKWEPCFVEMEDFQKITRNNIRATLDVCHLAGGYDSSQLLEQARKIDPAMLREVHFGDCSGIWQPFREKVKENLIPGTGKIGERALKDLLLHFLEISKKQDLNIVLEINEENYRQPINSQKAIEIVNLWIEELNCENN